MFFASLPLSKQGEDKNFQMSLSNRLHNLGMQQHLMRVLGVHSCENYAEVKKIISIVSSYCTSQ